ncbi:DUF1294 domain-containing protein [Lampropedia puyangensis]|uniref:DUF1294 domain-containing protein n=1 Tax=Lampropedia puyangensis TaxID=1330072 RepID=A0A4S8EXR5_9BURK|nr:cold shock and DUF1294 domain-containing protein [Lampropedia puyangensis]THT99338.1 DUF1294 domain-containing protein [Lampropedia puyangensis]
MKAQTNTQRQQGTLEQWNDDKGFGFVIAEGGGPKAFVHIKAFETRPRRPVMGDRISYNLERDAQGRWQATHVLLMDKTVRAGSTKVIHNKHGALPVWGWPLGLAMVALLTGLGLAAFKVLPSLLGLWLPVINVITFVVYAMDKSAAKQGAWRTKENTLHILSLLGGWPAALLAQRRLRHKSSKSSFQAVFWLTVVGNVLLMGWLTQSNGQEALQSILMPLLRNL